MERSPQWRNGRFHNPQPLWNDTRGMLGAMFRKAPNARPQAPLPVVHPTRDGLASPSPSSLRATWLGHSTVYLEVDGTRILTDPTWGRVLLPIHWGLFDLAAHGWTEPVERMLAAAGPQGVTVALPRPGEGFDPAGDLPSRRWWPDLPRKTAAEVSVCATLDGRRPIAEGGLP